MTNVKSITNSQISGAVIGTNVIRTEANIPNLGSPGYKWAEGIISGTYINAYTPQTGSRIEFHGLELSVQAVGIYEIKQSGAALKTQNKYYLPASGTVVKTFIHPIILPVNQSLGIGLWQPGSWSSVFYVREIK